MHKSVILCLTFVLCASASIFSVERDTELTFDDSSDFLDHNLEINTDQAEDFFLGFSSVFNLTTAAQNIIDCSTTQKNNFIKDLKNLVQAVQDNKWVDVISDGIKVLQDIQALQATCPAGADPFMQEFGPVLKAWNKSHSEFMAIVTKNCKSNAVELGVDIVKMNADFKKNDYNDAGVEFGYIVQTALLGILPS